jgi:hypothetical protein
VKRICSWCNREIDSADDRSVSEDAPISHGICPDCVRQIFSHKRKDLSSFLDQFAGPVFLLNAEGRVITANEQGFAALRKKPEEVEGQLGGDAFDCKYAGLQDGCGKTIHCKTCTIRNTVTDTFRTGESHIKVPAYPDLSHITGENRIRFLISTEKQGEAVLLRIDEISEEKKD